jgi:hypothetical protein
VLASESEDYILASAIAATLPGVELLPQPGNKPTKWSDFVEQRRELWPVQYLLPSGAYIH